MKARENGAAGGPLPVLIGCGSGGEAPPPAAIGFKAHALARMAALGLPVPPAFVIGTAWCAQAGQVDRGLWQPALAALERQTGLRFGDPRRPLLLSVRSGAPVSMPGMMDTLLNIGLGRATLHGLLRLTGNPRLVWDAYRRLVAGFGEVVMGVGAAAFEADVAAVAAGRNERDLDFIALRRIAERHLQTIECFAGQSFPEDPHEQLERAVRAVFDSWSADRAVAYRRLNRLDESVGTAVTVQRMVFGNAGGNSGAGVGFTRHPSTGEARPWVDFLFDAQGEDVVAGRRSASGSGELATLLPQVWEALLEAARQLERAFGDMQEFEFTVEDARLYLLQTRSGKRTPQAAARIALDLHDEGLIERGEVLDRTAGLDGDSLALARVVAEDAEGRRVALRPIAQATSACSGVASGEIVLDEEAARARRAAGADVLLLRQDAETADIAALEVAAGMLCTRGARTSHAAVVARQFGKVCLVSCDSLAIDLARRVVHLGGHEFREGERLTLDGNSGAIYEGAVRTVSEAPADLLDRLAALRTRTDTAA